MKIVQPDMQGKATLNPDSHGWTRHLVCPPIRARNRIYKNLIRLVRRFFGSFFDSGGGGQNRNCENGPADFFADFRNGYWTLQIGAGNVWSFRFTTLGKLKSEDRVKTFIDQKHLVLLLQQSGWSNRIIFTNEISGMPNQKAT